MAAAIYARYSSENQRPESIDDQVSACRKLAKLRSLTISDEHIYADQAQSGARSDRPALAALMTAARRGEFDVVLVDDLSRLARDNQLMLSIIAELHFEGIRVISVADGLDSIDEESTLAIQVRGIFNELQLRDLKKKTLRGQIGQKERGFFVGEKTFGYRSIPVGEMKIDKKGRPRPDGYKMEIEPTEAAIVLRIFTSYADGMPLTRIVKTFNEEGVPGAIRAAKGWSPATIAESSTTRSTPAGGSGTGPRAGGTRRPAAGDASRSPSRSGSSEKTKSYGSFRRRSGRRFAIAANRCIAPGRAATGGAASPAIRAAARNISRRTCSPAAWSAVGAAARSLRSAARAAAITDASPHQGRMREQDARAEDARREGDPGGHQAADLGS